MAERPKQKASALRRLKKIAGVSWTGDKPELPAELVKLRGNKLASEIASENRA